jgi:hypothetical protein
MCKENENNENIAEKGKNWIFYLAGFSFRSLGKEFLPSF